MLIQERPRITTALDKLRVFSDTATGLVNDTQDDLVTNLKNLEPTLRALADVGPDLDTALAYATVFPFGQNLIDRGVRGDYMNFFGDPRPDRPAAQANDCCSVPGGATRTRTLVPAPGEPYYLQVHATTRWAARRTAATRRPARRGARHPPTPQLAALPPVQCSRSLRRRRSATTPPPGSPIFAGPYGVRATRGGGG